MLSMKILHVCNHFHPCLGGIERHIEDLCKNLRELGHQSDVACLNTCAYSKEKLPRYDEYDGIKIYRLPYVNLRFYKIAPSIFRLIKEYDIIHVHGLGFFSDFLSLTKSVHKKPLFLSTHGGVFHTKDFYNVKEIYFNFWCKFTLKRFNKIIAVSKNDAQLFSKISSNVVFIPNAIEMYVFDGVGGSPEDYSFLYVGRISKNKRLDNMINTFYFLKKEISNIRLYLVGGDWDNIRKDLEILIQEKKLKENVIFTGGVEDRGELVNYFSKSKFFVSASEYEGFGISVLEAMAAGLIPIVNDIGAFRSYIKEGVNGFFVDYSVPERAANRILAILEVDMAKIDENAKETASKYDWSLIIKEIEEVYRGS